MRERRKERKKERKKERRGMHVRTYEHVHTA